MFWANNICFVEILGNLKFRKALLVFTIFLSVGLNYYVATQVEQIRPETPNAFNTILPDEAFNMDNAINLSSDMQEYGLKYVIDNRYNYTHAYHYLFTFLVGIHIYFFGLDALWLIFIIKYLLLFGVGYRLYYKAVSSFKGCDVAFCSVVFLLLYLPLSIHSSLLLRDDILFVLTAVFFWLASRFKNKIRYLDAILIIPIIVSIGLLRIHLAIVLLLFIFVDFVYDLILTWKLYSIVFSSGIILICALLLVQYRGIIPGFKTIEPYTVMKESVRVIFSPLPWKINTEPYTLLKGFYSVYWVMKILFFVLCIRLIIRSAFTNRRVLIVLLGYFIPYILVNDVGIRQVSIMIPFIVPFIIDFTNDNVNVKNEKKCLRSYWKFRISNKSS